VLPTPVPRQPAPFLACGAIRLRRHGGPNAFGNALGQGLADAMKPGYSAEEMAGDFQRENNRFAAAADEARRNALTQVDANTIVDNRPRPSSPGADAFYDQLVSMMNNPAEIDTTGSTLLAAGPGFSLGGGAPGALISGPGLRLPGDPSGPRLGMGPVDTMGQPLNGRSDYHAFGKLSDILTSSNGEQLGAGRLYEWLTYTVPDAQQLTAEINARYGLTQDPLLSRLDRMEASPIGSIFSLATRAFGGGQEAQDRMLTIGSAVEGLGISGAALTGRVADIFNAARPSIADASDRALVGKDYLSLFSGSDRLRLGVQFEKNQGLLTGETQYNGQYAGQLYVRAFDGKGGLAPGSVRLDLVGRVSENSYDLVDFKLSPRSPLTVRQEVHYPLLEQYGGLVTGNMGRDIGLPKNSVLPPTPVNIIRGPRLSVDNY